MANIERMAWTWGLVLILALALLLSVLPAAIIPYRPHTLFSWIILLLMALPLYAFMEIFSDWVMTSLLLTPLNRNGRIVYIVIVVVIFACIMWLILNAVRPYFIRWGV